MPTAGEGARLALAATLLAGAVLACQGSDPYYRNRGNDVGAGGTLHPSNVVAGAAGMAGAAGAGGGGGSSACSTCTVRVQYTCRSNDSGQASFVLDVTNVSSMSFALSSLTLRYWYTADASKPQALDCVAAKLGCTNLVTSADTNPGPKFVPVMPPRPLASPTANLYAEIAFKAGALDLDPLLDTGEIQLSVHNQDFSTIDQTDDWSYDQTDCEAMNGSAVDWAQITAYLDGVLVWGQEPPLVLPPTAPP